jgi:hypothetical protein
MKHIQKHIIVFSGFAVFILFGYFAFQNFNSSPSDELKNPISQSGRESNTGKSLTTLSQSGNQWGVSPFDTGIPFTQEMKDPTFHEPNLKWKTRQVTLNDGRTLTYEFGKGNPREVALDDKGIEKLAADCADMPPSIDIKPTNMRADMLWKNGFCNSENDRPRYLSKQVEYHLLMALSSPAWYDLYKKCESNIRFGDKYRSDPSLRFDQVFASGFLDINHFIQVDPETGWKQLNMALTNNLLNFILDSQLLIGRGDVITNPYGDCVDQYGFGIKENLGQALYNYSVLPWSIVSDFRL